MDKQQRRHRSASTQKLGIMVGRRTRASASLWVFRKVLGDISLTAVLHLPVRYCVPFELDQGEPNGKTAEHHCVWTVLAGDRGSDDSPEDSVDGEKEVQRRFPAYVQAFEAVSFHRISGDRGDAIPLLKADGGRHNAVSVGVFTHRMGSASDITSGEAVDEGSRNVGIGQGLG